jgi:hypothetical protein
MDALDLERGPEHTDVNSDAASSYHTTNDLQSRGVHHTHSPPLRELQIPVLATSRSRPLATIASFSLADASDTTVPPPFFVALTGYRLTCTALLIGLGAPKAVSAARGQAAANTLDWIVSILVALLYVVSI